MTNRKSFTDQLHRTIELACPPKRIISLVPSQTELLLDWGLHEEVVGITKFCVYPKHAVAGKVKIGGTKKFHFERIDALKPDLIIANKEENYQEGIERLAEKYPVWISDIITWADAIDMINKVGELTCQTAQALDLACQLQALACELQANQVNTEIRVLYLIWREPYMAVGKDTFIDSILGLCGFQNVCASLARYPVLAYQDIQALNPTHIFLSSEPYPFRAKHGAELQAICPESTILEVNGEMFSWYGSRLKQGLAYCKALINLVNRK